MFTKGETNYLARTMQPSTNMELVDKLAEANGSKVNKAGLETVDLKPIPESIDITVKSTTGVGAESKTIYLFNLDFLEAAVTNNGSGAGSITYTYGDGRSGVVYNKQIENAFGGRGIKIDEVVINAKDVTSDVGDEAFFSTCNMKLLVDDGEGNALPVYNFKWNNAISNQPNKDGIYRAKVNFRLSYLSQLKFVLDHDKQVTISFIPAKNQD